MKDALNGQKFVAGHSEDQDCPLYGQGKTGYDPGFRELFCNFFVMSQTTRFSPIEYLLLTRRKFLAGTGVDACSMEQFWRRCV